MSPGATPSEIRLTKKGPREIVFRGERLPANGSREGAAVLVALFGSTDACPECAWQRGKTAAEQVRDRDTAGASSSPQFNALARLADLAPWFRPGLDEVLDSFPYSGTAPQMASFSTATPVEVSIEPTELVELLRATGMAPAVHEYKRYESRPVGLLGRKTKRELVTRMTRPVFRLHSAGDLARKNSGYQTSYYRQDLFITEDGRWQIAALRLIGSRTYSNPSLDPDDWKTERIPLLRFYDALSSGVEDATRERTYHATLEGHAIAGALKGHAKVTAARHARDKVDLPVAPLWNGGEVGFPAAALNYPETTHAE